MSGEPLRGSIFVHLDDLEEVTMTPHGSYIPHELGKLPKLRVLTFAFCRGLNNLNNNMIKHFTTIEELTFHSCGVSHLEEDTFNNFTNLRLLNFACNHRASVSNILDVLSANNETNVQYLVLDMVGTVKYTSPVVLGRVVNGQCLRVWESVRHLSIRGILWQRLENAGCLKHLISLAAGFNSPLPLLHDLLRHNNHIWLLQQMRYMDVSHLLVTDESTLSQLTGCRQSVSWIPPSHSYFPKMISEWENNNCTDVDLIPNDTYKPKCKQHFVKFLMPPCLTYLQMDHLALRDPVIESACAYFTTNNLRYLNMSYRYNSQDWFPEHANIFGFTLLEIIDMCDFGILDYNKDLSANFPNVRELYLCKNSLGLGNMSQISHAPFLKILDLSSNKISQLPRDMFSLLDRLEILNLKDNYLDNLDWLNHNLESLTLVDLSGNELRDINVSNLHHFEQRVYNTALTLDMRRNPLLCGCGQLDHLHWMHTTQIKFCNQYELTCGDSSPQKSIFDVDISALRHNCENTTLKIILATVSVGVALIISSASVVIYRYRWAIKWKYYKAKYARRKKSLGARQTADSWPTFSTFIIYPYDDRDTSHWVLDILRNKIETEWQRRECFIRGRNDVPGKYDVANIVEGLTHSQTALWVICPAFFEDRWCDMAVNFAFQQLGVKNNAFLIMENRFEEYQVPKQFAHLLNPKWNNPRLRYTDDEDGRRLFWATLETFIPQ